MRLFIVALGVSWAAVAWGDRLIDTPTARKLPYKTFRIEYADSLANGDTQLGYLDAGIGTSFEAAVRTERLPGRPYRATADLTYNLFTAISGLSPGIAFGIQDLSNSTLDGRRPFACVTWREPATTLNGEAASEITLGIYYRKRPYGFVGGSIPFSKEVRFLVEHNGDRIAAGLEVRPIKPLGLRLLARGNRMVGDVSLMGRW